MWVELLSDVFSYTVTMEFRLLKNKELVIQSVGRLLSQTARVCQSDTQPISL